MELVVGAVSDAVVKVVVDPIKKHIGYALGFRGKVNSLSDEVQKLQVERDGLLKSIEDAPRLGEDVEPYVARWRDLVEEAIAEAEAVIQTGQVAAQRSCSSNLRTRYRMGKKADQGKRGIIQLLEETYKFDTTMLKFGNMQQPVKPSVEDDEAQSMQQTVKPPVEDYEAQSRTRIMNDVMEALLDPDITMVGVYCMGGIGKTTLAKEVLREAMFEESFDYVIMVTISAAPELRRIQDEIAQSLTGSKLQESTDASRASRLCNNQFFFQQPYHQSENRLLSTSSVSYHQIHLHKNPNLHRPCRPPPRPISTSTDPITVETSIPFVFTDLMADLERSLKLIKLGRLLKSRALQNSSKENREGLITVVESNNIFWF